MEYNSIEILNKLNNFCFPSNFRDETKYDMFDQCFNYQAYSISSGATKCVVIPKEKNYVIKIPFTGTGDYYKSYYDSNGYYHSTLDFYEDFYGADNDERVWDYCGAEVKRYRIAKEHHMEKFFAETAFVGYTTSDYPIYVQEKCTTLENTVLQYTHEEMDSMRHTLSSVDCIGELPIRWIISFFKTYGFDTLINFVNFLNAQDWNDDLRAANVGFLNKKPILIDFSGFNE